MTGLPAYVAWCLAGLVLCLALLILRRPVVRLFRLALRSGVGLAVLALLAQVMPGAEISTETPYRAPNALSITAGYRENELLGYCVEVQTHGFSGPITMVVGVDLNGQVTGVAVTDHSESTGMGTMAMENAQLRKYVGMSGTIRTSGANSVDVVTGATATSEAITAGVNQALAIVANLETDGSVQYVDSDV